MANKNNDIQSIFNKLSEQNKDILILVATSVKVAQDINEQNTKEYLEKQNKGSENK